MQVYRSSFQPETSLSNKIEQSTRISVTNKLADFSQALVSAFKDAGASLVHYLTRPDEIRVWQVNDRHGEAFWKAYDPRSNTTSYLSSEDDLRVWLEQRYYR
jgi:hypothetical protein